MAGVVKACEEPNAQIFFMHSKNARTLVIFLVCPSSLSRFCLSLASSIHMPGRKATCRGTSLIRNTAPLAPYSKKNAEGPMAALRRGAVSYERGTPVPHPIGGGASPAVRECDSPVAGVSIQEGTTYTLSGSFT